MVRPVRNEVEEGSKACDIAAATCSPNESCLRKTVMFYIISLVSGFIFAIGLGLANMTYPAKVLRFLSITDLSSWDPSLGFVMGGGLVLTFISFQLILRLRARPFFFGKYCVPTSRLITPNLVVGPVIFGLGWGLAGICPGPGIVGLVTGNPKIYVWFVGVVCGVYAEYAFGKFRAYRQARAAKKAE